MNNLGVIAIGRNEGDRLIRCLDSLREHLPQSVPIIYVDSGSTDNSIAEAKARDAQVISLDMSIPFTGARARNEGFNYLLEHFPQTKYVQFIDGDCELISGWGEAAIEALAKDTKLGVVFGQLKERFPEASAYNRLAAMEWVVPVGEVGACGGIAMMRSDAVSEVGGFNAQMICGEEPELCIRLRQQGWKVWCLSQPMAIHDMDMHRFGQWWKRSTRGGWAIAEGAAMYGDAAEQYMKRESLSGWAWGAMLPIFAVLGAIASHGATILLLVGAYVSLLLRLFYYQWQTQGENLKNAWTYAFFGALSKVPQAVGQTKYWLNHWQEKPATLIEYKG